MYRLKATSTPSITDAAALPAVKEYLRLAGEWTDELDAEIESLIERAITTVEIRTHRQILTRTYEQRFGKFPAEGCWHVPKPPLASVEAIKYLDADSAEQTWPATEYDVLTDVEPGVIRLAYEKSYPSSAREVLVEFTAGYGADWDSLPNEVRSAILLVCHHYWYDRGGNPFGAGIEMAFTNLLVGEQFVEYPVA